VLEVWRRCSDVVALVLLRPLLGTVLSTESGRPEWLPYYREAQLLERSGRLSEAEQQYHVVVDVCVESSDTVPLATARRDLGRVLALQRRFDRAEEQYRLSLDTCVRVLGCVPRVSCLSSSCVYAYCVCVSRVFRTVRAFSLRHVLCGTCSIP
jgi:hypothetical protein